MDYEKAYKDALERAKNMIDDLRKGEDILAVSELEAMFPELRDSEDERIRKNIVSIINQYSRICAKEGDSCDDINECLAWFEKQKEQKPAEWSEEDEKTLDCIINVLDRLGYDEFCKSSRDQDIEEERFYYKEIQCLKKLKSLRPQPQGTYKQVIHTIFSMLKDKDFYEIQPSHRVSLLNDIRVKCKDAIECAPILDEPSWKPSEEQMEALGTAKRWYSDNMGCNRELESLYNGLKKLM